MALAAGTRLGPYEILEPLGAGGGRSMMTVAVRHGPALSLGRSTTLFRLPDRASAGGYDLHPDGRRFLVGVLAEYEPSPPITRLTLVHNWFTELERLSPR